MLSFMLTLTAKENYEQKAIEVLSEIDRQANTHQGCITFMWFQHTEAPLIFTLIEQWESQQVLDTHIAKITDIWNTFVPYIDGQAVSTKLSRLVNSSVAGIRDKSVRGRE